MKVNVHYTLDFNKTIEITPEDYCKIKVDHRIRQDIFPDGCFDVSVTPYDFVDQNELISYLQNKK